MCGACWDVLATGEVRMGTSLPAAARLCAFPGCGHSCHSSPLVFFCSDHAVRHRRPAITIGATEP